MKRTILSLLLAGASLTAAAALPQVEVFKSPHCGCCGKWADHLRAAGFPVKVTVTNDAPAARKTLGMPDRYGSCHTAKVAGYAIEGHVPAADIKALLTRKPKAIGLSVPGMPQNAPGMDLPSKERYDTLLIDKSGQASVFASHP